MGLVGLSVGTDNQGNTYLLDKMLTTKYPLGVVLMEMAHQCRLRQLVLRAHWIPRLENEEADALTNLDFRHFDPKNRIDVSLSSLKFGVLDALFGKGQDYLAELAEVQARTKARKQRAIAWAGSGPEEKKKKMGDTLAQRDPW